MTEFAAIENSSILDVCLNTYGSLNYLGKLLFDNKWPSATTYPKAGDIFMFDETLVNIQTNQNLNKNFLVTAGASQIKFATR